MDVSRLALNRLAGSASGSNLPNFMAPVATPQLHVATVAGVDKGRNECRCVLNDFGQPEVARVPVLGDGTVLPQEGDVVQLVQIGNTLAILGRQYRPTGAVTF